MGTKIAAEAVLYALLYTAFMLALFFKQGAKHQLYNYPPAIQKRAIEKGITTQAEMDANSKKNKVPGLIVMLGLCLVFTCGVNGVRSFWPAFVQSYIFLNAFSLFDALVIDSLWFCNGRWWVIPGTEDMTEAYHDYAFHWKWFFLGLMSSAILAAVTGGLAVLIGMVL